MSTVLRCQLPREWPFPQNSPTFIYVLPANLSEFIGRQVPSPQEGHTFRDIVPHCSRCFGSPRTAKGQTKALHPACLWALCGQEGMLPTQSSGKAHTPARLPECPEHLPLCQYRCVGMLIKRAGPQHDRKMPPDQKCTLSGRDIDESKCLSLL